MADLAAIYGAFRVDEPIPADDDDRYVDLAHVRGQIKVAARLAERVKRAGPHPSHHLLMGHTKCGKTTELNRVALRLRQECYAVVVVDVEATLDRRGEAIRLGNLGNCYADLGEPQRAIALYEQALAIAQELGDRSAEMDRKSVSSVDGTGRASRRAGSASGSGWQRGADPNSNLRHLRMPCPA